MVDIFQITGVLGLICIILAVLITKHNLRKKLQYPLLILGGILLTIYSIYIKDNLFIILQIIFTLSALYGLAKIHKTEIKDAIEFLEHHKKKNQRKH